LLELSIQNFERQIFERPSKAAANCRISKEAGSVMFENAGFATGFEDQVLLC
jgi:hypothetical protein